MNFKELLRLLIFNLQILLFTVCIAGILGLFYIQNQIPLFQSTARIFISTQSNASDLGALVSGSSFSQQRVKSYEQIVGSPLNLQPVIDKLKLNSDPHALSSKISAHSLSDTVLLDVSAIDPNPVFAAQLANAVAEQFTNTIKEIESNNADPALSVPIQASLVDYASPSGSPASPNKLKLMLTFLAVGFVLGFGIVVIRRNLLDTVRNEDDLLGLPLLMANGFDEEAETKPLLTEIDKYSPRAESFRALRASLVHGEKDNNWKVIAVTSALSGEGKTTTAINLALSLARAGKSTLLIEADLRRPKLPKYFNIVRESLGLSDLLQLTNFSGQLNQYKKYVKKFPGEKLDYITSGEIPSFPSELFEKDHFTILIASMRKKYDYVVIDCPPCLPVADSISISKRSDCVILITKAGSTKIQQLKGAKTMLERTGIPVIGAVINMIPYQARDGSEYGYRYGYSYSMLNRINPFGKYGYGKYGYGKYGYGKYGYGKNSEFEYSTYIPDGYSNKKIDD